MKVNSIESLDPLKALKYIINLNVSENKVMRSFQSLVRANEYFVSMTHTLTDAH